MITAQRPRRRTRIDEPIAEGPQCHTDPPLYTGKTQTARMPSVCPYCNEEIAIGQTIAQAVIYRAGSQRRRWVHPNCKPGTGETGEQSGIDLSVLQKFVTVDVHQVLVEKVADIEQRTPRVLKIEVEGRPTVEFTGLTHPALPEVVELLMACEHVFLPGPAGCGKTHLARQAADALGMGDRFYSISCSAGMSEAHLLGRCIPRGKSGSFEFVGTPFLDAYENGGVFLIDEMDAADPNVLLVINSALANGHLSVPSRLDKPVATRHADFRCMAAANTFGRGADRQYVGRSQLDESTLDRFRFGTCPMDYDRNLERSLWESICGTEHDAMLQKLWRYRDAIVSNRLERVPVDAVPDFRSQGAARGRDLEYIEAKLFAGWRADEISKVKAR